MTTPTKANKKKSRRNLTVVLISTITVLTWIGFETYRSLVTTKVKPEIKDLITPLDPQLETGLVDELEEKLGYNREDLKTNLSQPVAPVVAENEVETETGDEITTAEIRNEAEEGEEATPAATPVE